MVLSSGKMGKELCASTCTYAACANDRTMSSAHFLRRTLTTMTNDTVTSKLRLVLLVVVLIHGCLSFGVLVVPVHHGQRTMTAWMSSSSQQEVVSEVPITTTETTITKEDDDDDDDWEYVEMDSLKESDLAGSEWLVGTNWDNDSKKIKETWCRLAVTEKGQNLAVWGDKSEGKWNFDVASQFLSISKETFGGWGGKKIWAGTVDDYYYLQGTIRGWSPIAPASVLGQWQAKRLGVDEDEAGTAPWFDEGYLAQQEEVAKANLEKKQEQEGGGIF